MIDNIATINKEFLKNFPEIYSRPSKINKFLNKHSNEV